MEKDFTHVDDLTFSEPQATGGMAPASAHSPLPWFVHEHDPQRVCFRDDPAATVARTFVGAGVRDRDTAKVNAHFIVTACNAHFELLAAGKELRAAASALAMAVVMGTGLAQHEARFNAAHDAMTAAIAKAEGRSPSTAVRQGA